MHKKRKIYVTRLIYYEPYDEKVIIGRVVFRERDWDLQQVNKGRSDAKIKFGMQ